MLIAREGNWLSATIGEEIVMMSAKSGEYIGLNSVGSRIWELIEQPRDFGDLCARLEAEFDIAPADCIREVEGFLAELEQHRAIRR
jgi:Coenzyme PQQ synthesis protein D (PqqD)